MIFLLLSSFSCLNDVSAMQVSKYGRLREVCAALPQNIGDQHLYDIYCLLLYTCEIHLCNFPYEMHLPPSEYINFFCYIPPALDWLQFQISFGISSFKFICRFTSRARVDRRTAITTNPTIITRSEFTASQ